MAPKDLIPTDISKRPDHIELSRKGGQSKSKAKHDAVTLNALKQPGVKPETKERWLTQMCKDPETSAKLILDYLKEIKTECWEPDQKTRLSKVILDWYKIRYPPTQKIEHSGQIDHVVSYKDWLQAKKITEKKQE